METRGALRPDRVVHAGGYRGGVRLPFIGSSISAPRPIARPIGLVFEGPVAGLRTGGNVTFNGIRVGEITAVSAADPRHVVATVSVDRSAPVRADTQVGLEFQGLTGIASVSLRGGAVDAPPLAPASDGVPTLRANGPILDVTEAVRSTLQKVDQVIIDNQQSLKAALASIEAFTKTLERNSDRVDNVMIGMERLSGTQGQGRRGLQGRQVDPRTGREPRQAHRRDRRQRQPLSRCRRRSRGHRPPHASGHQPHGQQFRPQPVACDLGRIEQRRSGAAVASATAAATTANTTEAAARSATRQAAGR